MSRTDGHRGNRKRSRNYRKAVKALKRIGHRNERHGKTKFWDVKTVRTWKYYY